MLVIPSFARDHKTLFVRNDDTLSRNVPMEGFGGREVGRNYTEPHVAYTSPPHVHVRSAMIYDL